MSFKTEVRKCWRSECEHNYGGCYCNTDEIELDSFGQCMTYCEKDIYREVEGFSRESKSNI